MRRLINIKLRNLLHIKTKKVEGFILPSVLALIIVFSILIVSVGNVIVTTLGSASHNQNSQMALNIAEAGMNYYLWHMSHDNGDYKDGQATPAIPDNFLGYGPYTHDYRDASGALRGTYTLYIKPGDNGSNVATVRSKGQVTNGFGVQRTVQARLGAPSFSTYAVASNSQLWFGDTEVADGPVHSNAGVKMDGVNNSIVTSSNTTYVPSSTSGPGSGVSRPGVWCYYAISNPNCATRSKTSWHYPAPTIDFNKVTADLCQLKKNATNNQAANSCSKQPARNPGYVPPVQNGYSKSRGYLINLNNDGTYNLKRVNGENDTKSNYGSALSITNVANGITIPDDGVIFVEDNVWLRTDSNGFNGRVTIASARLAVSGQTNATIVDNLLYKDKYSGSNAIGLIAQDNVEIAPYVPAPLEVDGALIAQNGAVRFRPTYNYNGNSTPGYINASQAMTFYGSVASNEQWTWSYIRCGYESSACWSGFKYTNTKYDDNLRYSPPPHFPVTSTYDILEWREIIATP